MVLPLARRRCARPGYGALELLIILLLVALLLAILILSVTFARRQAGRTSNVTNLAGLMKAATLFDHDRGGSPGVSTRQARINDGAVPRDSEATIRFGGLLGKERNQATLEASRDVSAGRPIWQLCRYGISTRNLINPLTEDTPDPVRDAEGVYDVASGSHLSYGYQSVFYAGNQPDFGERPGANVAFVDRGPVYRHSNAAASRDNGAFNDISPALAAVQHAKIGRRTLDEVPDAIRRSLNSPNDHGETNGVVCFDGGASVEKGPWAGSQRDNIYTVATGEDAATRSFRGTFGEGSQPELTEAERKRNENDSYIIP